MTIMTNQTDETPARLRSVAVEASTAAGRMLLNFAKTGFTVQHKNPIDLVTDADHAAEQCIIDHIRRHFPTHHTLAEERGADAHVPSRYRIDGSSIRWMAPRTLPTDFPSMRSRSGSNATAK